MSGRTTWWPCDSTEHTRERNVDLGIHFGSGGPLVMRVLKDMAQQQRDESDSGTVMSGFSVLAHLCFLKDGASEARQIIEHAGKNGSLDELVIADDGRFTCRVSGWTADSVRGRAALKKAGQRAAKKDAEETTGLVPPEGDLSPREDAERDVSDIAVTGAVTDQEQNSDVKAQTAATQKTELDRDSLRVVAREPASEAA